MTTLLKAQLRSASFRGVRFSVAEAEFSAGRRTQIHEYPLRDMPYVEDIGRAARRYSLTAYIVGTDYLSRVKSLVGAMETRGSGHLVHPWLGEIDVTPTSVGTVSFDTKLGLATIKLSFIESGSLQVPAAKADFLQRMREAIDGALSSAQNWYEKAVQTTSVFDSAVSAAAVALGQVQAMAATGNFLRDSGLLDAIGLVRIGSGGDVVQLAKNLIRVMDCSSLVGLGHSWRSGATDLARLSSSSNAAIIATSEFIPNSADAVTASAANAVFALARSVAAIEAAGCASVAGTSDDKSNEPISYDALLNVRDDVCSALDEAILACDDDELAIELESLRSQTYFTLTERARGEAKLISLPVPTGEPLVVAAYRKYGDAERADELAELNAVRNIGFAPAGGLKALSE